MADAALERTDRTTLVAFVLSVFLGAGNPIAIRIVACETCELEPFFAAASRFLLAGAVLGIVAFATRAPVPRGRELTGALLFGVLQFGAGFACVCYGYAHTPAGLGQVLLACVPLLTFGLAIAHRQERFRWEGLVGALLAIVGIAAVFGSGADEGVPIASMLVILLGAVFWAEGLIVVRAFPPTDLAAMNAVAMAAGVVVLLPLSALAGRDPRARRGVRGGAPGPRSGRRRRHLFGGLEATRRSRRRPERSPARWCLHPGST